MAGLVFGGLSFYGAYNITYDSKDIKVSLCENGYIMLFKCCLSTFIFWYFLSCSVCRTPVRHHGSEIQEIWKTLACWHYVRAQVRVQLTQRN